MQSLEDNKSKQISDGVVHKTPSDLKAALRRNKTVLVYWENITPLARNEWICWTISPKKPETRADHVKRVVSELNEGIRRPCCWIGCIHRSDKPLSPSVKWALKTKRS